MCLASRHGPRNAFSAPNSGASPLGTTGGATACDVGPATGLAVGRQVIGAAWLTVPWRAHDDIPRWRLFGCAGGAERDGSSENLVMICDHESPVAGMERRVRAGTMMRPQPPLVGYVVASYRPERVR